MLKASQGKIGGKPIKVRIVESMIPWLRLRVLSRCPTRLCPKSSSYLTHGFAARCEARLAAPYAYFFCFGASPLVCACPHYLRAEPAPGHSPIPLIHSTARQAAPHIRRHSRSSSHFLTFEARPSHQTEFLNRVDAPVLILKY